MMFKKFIHRFIVNYGMLVILFVVQFCILLINEREKQMLFKIWFYIILYSSIIMVFMARAYFEVKDEIKGHISLDLTNGKKAKLIWQLYYEKYFFNHLCLLFILLGAYFAKTEPLDIFNICNTLFLFFITALGLRVGMCVGKFQEA